MAQSHLQNQQEAILSLLQRNIPEEAEVQTETMSKFLENQHMLKNVLDSLIH